MYTTARPVDKLINFLDITHGDPDIIHDDIDVAHGDPDITHGDPDITHGISVSDKLTN